MNFDKDKFLSALKGLKESFTVAQKFVDAKLADGTTIIRYEGDSLDIGVAVMAVTEQGAIALPDGDYDLEDGTKFSIVAGLVSAVTPAEEAPAEEAAEAPAEAPAAMTEAKAKSVLESIIKETRFAEDIAELKLKVAEFAKVNEAFATAKETEETEVSKLKEQVKGMFELLEKLADEPSAAPAEKKKVTFSVAEQRKAFKEDLDKLQTN